MGRNSDNLLGMGGQRNTVSRSALRGGKGGGRGGPSDDAVERKQELLRKLREKQGKDANAEHEETEGARGQA
ncbi:hypothetical protein KGD83_01065 [Nocardiopsis akebiae]|uniref:Uncharacterized protein n=1 Tax=Nocardiopsis akebiae TaxID=2831968 RepID=A0ABX8C489_9ACTN|nr:DUF6243 family protein [Nocardiopsis akebiae]QUX29224.1 hypothetical protein KGD83_01065 [Nocardiopsis akebiae]